MNNEQDTKQLAEQLLMEIFHEPVQLDTGVALANRSHVLRFSVLEGPSSAPASIVVKRPRDWGGPYDPNSTDPHNPARYLLREWAGLLFLQQVAGDANPAPRLYGGNRQYGMVILEDLGSGVRPDQALLGDDPQLAETMLLELATQLGILHSSTIGREGEYAAACAAIGYHPLDDDQILPNFSQALSATLAVLNITPPPGLDAELRAFSAAMQQPGPFWAYTHGDPCPDNWLHGDNTLRILDFERGAFRHALRDGVYGRILFPTCWCVNRLPEHLPRAMEAAYRRALAANQPEAADDTLFGRAVVEACVYWAFDTCQWVVERPVWYAEPRVLAHDRQWGISTIRQRALVRAELLAQATAEYRYLEAIGAAFQQIARVLRSHWPPAADEMPYYPAFRTQERNS